MTAKLVLSEAERVGPADDRYGTFVGKATDQLYLAHGLVSQTQNARWSSFNSHSYDRARVRGRRQALDSPVFADVRRGSERPRLRDTTRAGAG